MKLHSISPVGQLSISSYDSEHIVVSGTTLSRSFILSPQGLNEQWSPTSFDALTMKDIQALADLNCPIVLLGTGTKQRFPSPDLLQPIMEKRIGIEIMDNFAACRTFNILVAEGREVALAIIMEPGA